MRSSSSVLAAVFAPLLFACGLGVSQATPHGEPSPPADAGEDAGCGDRPPIECAGTCGGGGGSAPQCIDGTWQCPVFNGPACPVEVDAGCAGAPPLCPLDCAGEGTQAVCVEGEWSCLGTACPEDAGPPEDASPDPLFACGDLACDPTTSYCEIFAGGPVLEDGGTPTSYSCHSLPASCAPGAATCACINGASGSAVCGCVASEGKVIETCEVP